MTPSPRMLSPALPSELLSSIIAQHSYPTTLVICGSREDFLSTLMDEMHEHQGHEAGWQQHNEDSLRGDGGAGELPKKPPGPPTDTSMARSMILSAPLFQVAIARHIRTVFVPTVSHLRAFLSVFTGPSDQASAVRAPPPPPLRPPVTAQATLQKIRPPPARPVLLVYGLLDLHHDTSEWSAQGLSCTAAGLVEAADRVRFDTVVVESSRRRRDRESEASAEGTGSLSTLLSEEVPVLGGSARRMGPEGRGGGGGWAGRTVPVGRVLGRWFRFLDGHWKGNEAYEDQDDGADEQMAGTEA